MELNNAEDVESAKQIYVDLMDEMENDRKQILMIDAKTIDFTSQTIQEFLRKKIPYIRESDSLHTSCTYFLQPLLPTDDALNGKAVKSYCLGNIVSDFGWVNRGLLKDFLDSEWDCVVCYGKAYVGNFCKKCGAQVCSDCFRSGGGSLYRCPICRNNWVS